MLKSENDSEIEIILAESSEISLASNDKPLSPILNSSNLHRKFLFGKRTTHKKSRRKLSDKFEDANSKPTTSNEKNIDLHLQLHNFNEDSFSLSQSDDLINCLDRLEEIEKNREHVYKLLVRNKKIDFCFKKPTSPAPNKPKKIKCDVSSSKEKKFGNMKDENIFDNIFPVPHDIPKGSGFQTATGKQLAVSEQLLKKHERLFEDILTPIQQVGNVRKNKYNFLSKTKCSSTDKYNGNQSYIMPASNGGHLENLGLSTNIVDDEDIITHSSGQMISEIQESISLTQEICNSEISNSQIIFAADKALDKIQIGNNDINSSNPNAEFRGFSIDEIFKSVSIHQEITKIHNELSCLRKPNDSVAGKDFTPVSRIPDHQHSGLGKHMLDNLDLPPTKRLKQEITLLEVLSGKQRPEWKENVLSPLGNNSSCISSEGFSSASGKSIAISSNSMKRAKIILDEIELEMIEDKKSKLCEDNIDIIGHKRLNDNSFPSQRILKNDDLKTGTAKIKTDILKESNCSVENSSLLSVNKITNLENSDQSDASLKSVSATKSLYSVKDKLKYFDAMIENEDFHLISTRNPNNNLGFSTASGNSLKPSQKFLKVGESIFADINKNTSQKSIHPDRPSKLTAQADAKNKLKLMDEALRIAESKSDSKAEKLYTSPLSFGKGTGGSPIGFVSAARKPFCIADASMKESYNDFDGIKSYSSPTRSNLGTKSSFSNSRQLGKKKLGVTSCKQIPISETKLNRAKQLFQEEFLNMSPIKPVKQIVTQTSTPQRESNCVTPIRNKNSRPSNSFPDLDTSESPVVEAVEQKDEEFLLGDDLLVTFSKTTRGSTSNIMSDLEDERKLLEKRLKVITERQDALADLKKEKSDTDIKPCLGVMYQAKLRGNTVPIISFVDGTKPGETCLRHLFCISPQNAENIHFKEFGSKISTKDCATVVPNSKDLIGLPEIDYALRTMPGVEDRLIPKGWIRNHYKWIIWKLASYERMFPLHFSHILNVEHAVQQLKYRYDREIDKAERPALRKIYEKDDAAQKRIVLCVSDIKKVESDKFELELTDGWYGIRTVIDDPLCNQILKQKIKIGTKLITCGAELMNCDGCSPLETTNLTYLKINFNCTRRAIWNARLGYQRFAGPFPIQIHSVHPSGGTIGAIQITIARIYPTKYLEKLENQSVWRNERAEERRAQEWEVERCKKMEQIENAIRKEFSSCFNNGLSKFKTPDVGSEISKINCPEMLLSILENSNDPDSLQEMMSSTQRLSVVEYKRNLVLQKQQEISSKIKQNAEKLKMLTRDVIPILKMLVVDINGSPTRAFSFTVWHPTESHYQILREGTSVNAYNVLPRMNGDLSCSSKTIFKPESPKEPMSEIFRRKVIEIGELSELKFSVNFSEFDTVGLVIQLKIGVKFQEVCLADLSGRLLLISIYESPSTCLLIDNLKRGQAVSVCNLRFRKLTDDVSQAIGNHFTVFSLYSQHKHLREYLEDFKKAMPKSCDKLLEDCDNKIEKFRCKTHLPSASLDESDEDTLVSSRITSTDLALSLIDMDKYT